MRLIHAGTRVLLPVHSGGRALAAAALRLAAVCRMHGHWHRPARCRWARAPRRGCRLPARCSRPLPAVRREQPAARDADRLGQRALCAVWQPTALRGDPRCGPRVWRRRGPPALCRHWGRSSLRVSRPPSISAAGAGVDVGVGAVVGARGRNHGGRVRAHFNRQGRERRAQDGARPEGCARSAAPLWKCASALWTVGGAAAAAARVARDEHARARSLRRHQLRFARKPRRDRVHFVTRRRHQPDGVARGAQARTDGASQALPARRGHVACQVARHHEPAFCGQPEG